MKIKCKFLLLFFVCIQSMHAEVRTDTTFLLREIIDSNVYHAVYIEDNRKSDIYDIILHSLNGRKDDYDRGMSDLKDSIAGVRRSMTIPDIDRDWLSLYQYKNGYYIYSPSEGYTNSRIIIKDSVVTVNIFGDGVMPAIIKKVTQQNVSLITFDLISSYVFFKYFKIHIIDKTGGIAVFEFPYATPEHRYKLMVSAAHMRQFPVIVNYCSIHFVPEWEFDKPNFKKLLK